MSDNRPVIGHEIRARLEPVQTQELVASLQADLRRELEQLVNEARQFAGAAQSGNTRRAYESDWADFQAWCDSLNFQSCPASPETVALYLTHLARTRKASTLSRRLAAISHFHQRAREIPPVTSIEVRTVLAGIRRKKGTAPRRKRPLLGASVVASMAKLPQDTLLGIRNRALLLIGYAGALRRSELVSLDWEDCDFTDEGLRLTIRKSKTDQTGQGSEIGIPAGSTPETCPVQALQTWKQCSAERSGPIFRVVGRANKVMEERLSSKAVARLVKDVAIRLGLDPKDFSAHSLRAGLATTAAQNGVSERKIMDQTRHRSVKTVRAYIRDGELFRDNAAAKGGL